MDVFINKVQAVKLFQSSNAAEKSFIFYPVIYILLLFTSRFTITNMCTAKLHRADSFVSQYQK